MTNRLPPDDPDAAATPPEELRPAPGVAFDAYLLDTPQSISVLFVGPKPAAPVNRISEPPSSVPDPDPQ